MLNPQFSKYSPSSQTASTCRSPSFPSGSRSSTCSTPASTPVASLATPERPTTPPVDIAATSSLYWELIVPPPFHVPSIRQPDLQSLALSGDTYSEIRHDGPLRMSNEMTYYFVLQHYHQWRNAQDINPWLLATRPRSQQVMKYGLMHSFLHSLGPPPPGWICPPPTATDGRRRHHRRHWSLWCHKSRGKAQAQVLGESGSPKQAGPSAKAGLTEETGCLYTGKTNFPVETSLLVATQSEAVLSPLDEAKKCGKRGKRGKRGGRRRGKKGKADKASEDKQGLQLLELTAALAML